MLFLGGFILDEMLGENISIIQLLSERWKLHQGWHYSTLLQGNLDLIFDSKIAQSDSQILSPLSCHFTLCVEF